SDIQKGSIVVYCNENNAKIFINGIYKATTSTNQAKIIDDFKEGVYEVTVIKDGYRVWLEETWVYPGEITSIFADLVKIDN
ncbi:MAG: PEGA domain-containing protein, partial [Candidatus Hydrogenedentota bacterium]